MDTVSLISLVIDYEVPPSEIIDAIVQRKLRPIVARVPPSFLDEIAFNRNEVSNVFWSYELKRKSVAEKAELTRRLNRYDAIVTGIISAVVATGVVATVAEIFSTDEREQLRPQSLPDPPEFGLPIESPFERFVITKAAYFIRIERRSLTGRFRVIAAAPGRITDLASTPHDYIAPRVGIDHGNGWWSFYGVDAGHGNFLVRVGGRVDRGRPVLELVNTHAEKAAAEFTLWRFARDHLDGSWSSYLHLVDWSKVTARS